VTPRLLSNKADSFAIRAFAPLYRQQRFVRMPKAMDETEEFKHFLGLAAEGYSDAQLRQLRREMHARAELLLDIYFCEKSNESSRQDS
jgi:hypothetical protein